MAAEKRRPLGPKSSNQLVSPAVSRQSSLSASTTRTIYSSRSNGNPANGDDINNAPSRHSSFKSKYGSTGDIDIASVAAYTTTPAWVDGAGNINNVYRNNKKDASYYYDGYYYSETPKRNSCAAASDRVLVTADRRSSTDKGRSRGSAGINIKRADRISIISDEQGSLDQDERQGQHQQHQQEQHWGNNQQGLLKHNHLTKTFEQVSPTSTTLSSENPTIRLVPKTPPPSSPSSTLLKADPTHRYSSSSSLQTNHFPYFQARYSDPSSTRDEFSASSVQFSSTSTRTSNRYSSAASSLISPPSTVSQRTVTPRPDPPPSRPLPEPPVTPKPALLPPKPPAKPRPTIRLVDKTPPPSNTPHSQYSEDTLPPLPVPGPILKKPRTQLRRPSTSDSAEDIVPSINVSEHPEIRPALSWILEDGPSSSKINSYSYNRRARMQADAPGAGGHHRDRSGSNGGNNLTNGSNPLEGPSRWFSVSDRSTTMSTVRPNNSGPSNGNGAAWAHPGPENQPRLVQPSQSRVGKRVSRAPSTLSIFSSRGFPEWARLYYGRGGKGLITPPTANGDNARRVQRIGSRHAISLRQLHSRGGDSVEDDLQISEIQPPRRSLQPIFQAPVEWIGTRNPEGRDLADQFHSPRLDNRPLVRTERLNPHLLLFLTGFVFPLAWIAGAFYPLPDQKRLRYRESLFVQFQFPPTEGNPRLRRPSMDTESLPSITTFEESRRWENGKWWRNVNRGMSVVALLVVAAIVTLVVIGTMKRTTSTS